MTIKSNATQVLEQLILVSLSDITSISGRRKLKKKILVTVLICHLMYLFH